MFGSSSKFFEVYVKKDSKNSFDDIILLKRGFNFFAFIFSTFWALYQRIWWLFFALFIIEGFIFYQINFAGASFAVYRGIAVAIQVWLGFEATDIRGKNLENKGYILIDVVCAQDETEANRRFLDKYALATNA